MRRHYVGDTYIAQLRFSGSLTKEMIKKKTLSLYSHFLLNPQFYQLKTRDPYFIFFLSPCGTLSSLRTLVAIYKLPEIYNPPFSVVSRQDNRK
jgi:hypothetical protein